METKSLLSEKSYEYAKEIIKVYQKLNDLHHYSLSDQLMRSGTSIGANIRESKFTQSNADVVAKLFISLREANENEFWLDLLYDSGILIKEDYVNLKNMCLDIKYMLIASIRHVKNKNI